MKVALYQDYQTERYEHLSKELVKLGNEVLVIQNQTMAPMVEQFKPDVVHSATAGSIGYLGREYALSTNTPWFVEADTTITESTYYEPAQLVFAHNTADTSFLNKHSIFRIKRWTDGVDLDKWNPDNANRRQTAMPVEGHILLCRTDDLQRAELIERMFYYINQSHICMGIICPGYEKKTPRRRLHIMHSVSEEDVATLLASSAVYIHADPSEVGKTRLVQAMASGCAIVAIEDDNSKDLIDYSVNGYIIGTKNKDPYELSVELWVATELIIDNTNRRVNMGRASRAKVSHYSWEQTLESVICAYRDAMNKTGDFIKLF